MKSDDPGGVRGKKGGTKWQGETKTYTWLAKIMKISKGQMGKRKEKGKQAEIKKTSNLSLYKVEGERDHCHGYVMEEEITGRRRQG